MNKKYLPENDTLAEQLTRKGWGSIEVVDSGIHAGRNRYALKNGEFSSVSKDYSHLMESLTGHLAKHKDKLFYLVIKGMQSRELSTEMLEAAVRIHNQMVGIPYDDFFPETAHPVSTTRLPDFFDLR